MMNNRKEIPMAKPATISVPANTTTRPAPSIKGNSFGTIAGATIAVNANEITRRMRCGIMRSPKAGATAMVLTNVATIFREKCVEGIVANEERCTGLIEFSLSMVTSLAPVIGYDPASKIAKESVTTGKTVRELCLERLDELGITEEQLTEALDAASMTGA